MTIPIIAGFILVAILGFVAGIIWERHRPSQAVGGGLRFSEPEEQSSKLKKEK